MSEADLSAIQDALAGVLSVERELGRGGMGTVYLARDVALDRPVALKVLHAEHLHDTALRERFLREARTGARLAHPHIVPIYDVGETGDQLWIVMGLVDGESLSERVSRLGGLPPVEVERVLTEIAWALANAHARGILHRDVTLDNILIDRRSGRAMLVDFGIAAPIEGGEAGQLVGTASYIAPELIHGEPATAASDLYALGIVGWAALTGFLPFNDLDPATILLRRIHEEIPPLTRAAAATPRRLREAIEALLARDPQARPASAEAWLEEWNTPHHVVHVAEPLTTWLEQRDAVAPYHALALTIVALATATSIGGVHLQGGGLFLLFLLGWLFAVATRTIVQAVLRFSAMRRLLRAGYRVEDMRLALDRYLANRRQRGPEQPSLTGQIIRTGGTIAGTMALALVVLAPLAASAPLTIQIALWQFGIPLVKGGVLLYWLSRSIGALIPGRVQLPIDLRLQLRERFWRSRVGEWVVRCARIGLPRTILPERTLHRPTELMLELQIEQLWENLPAKTREGIAELPTLARSLRERVRDLRTLMERCESAGRSSMPELAVLRSRLDGRRQDATDALERLRLLVTRLGTAAAPAGDLTHDLRNARVVEAAVLRELGAHQEIGRLLDSSRLSPTPA